VRGTDGTELRRARVSDVAVIAELTVRAYIDGGHMPPESPYVDTLRNVSPRVDETFVLSTNENTDEIVAAVAALPYGHPMTEATEPGEWEFRYLAVRKDHWGQGLGTLLIAAVEDKAKSHNAGRMVLRVVDDNPRAMRLYEHLGYRHQPHRDISFESSTFPGRMINLLLYAKDLH